MTDSTRRRLRGFGHALRGLRTLVATQPHARVHVVGTVAVGGAGLACGLERWEWAAVVAAAALVWAAEALNTAVEFLADEVTLERRERIKHAKDVAAAGVLAAALGAAAVGLLVFAPHVL